MTRALKFMAFLILLPWATLIAGVLLFVLLTIMGTCISAPYAIYQSATQQPATTATAPTAVATPAKPKATPATPTRTTYRKVPSITLDQHGNPIK